MAKEKHQTYKPETNDEYWFYYKEYKQIMCFNWTYAEIDEKHYREGNCFKTKKEAEEYAKTIA